MNTITAAPEASPSRPSVRFTPFAVAAIMTYAQITNRVDPTAPAANTTLLSRTNETVREAGVSPEWLRKPSASTANAIDTTDCPASLALDFSPRLRCLTILMLSLIHISEPHETPEHL